MKIDETHTLLGFGPGKAPAEFERHRSSECRPPADSHLLTTRPHARPRVSGRLLSAAQLAVGVMIPVLLVSDSIQALALFALDLGCGFVLGLAMHRRG